MNKNNNNYNLRHRKSEDIGRQLLNYLKVNGPTNITKCLLFLEINHKQMKKLLLDLVPHGLVIRQEITQMDVMKHARRRKGRLSVFNSNTPMDRLPPRAVSVLSITPIGITYLEKANKVGKMLKWGK